MKSAKIPKNIFLISICICIAIAAGATNLRGRIVRRTAIGDLPVANVQVKLVIYDPVSESWQSVSYVKTGADGFYYFLNFSPGQIFYVSINGRYYPPLESPLKIQSVDPGRPPYYQDIPPISL